jgi:hypothetical protein
MGFFSSFLNYLWGENWASNNDSTKTTGEFSVAGVSQIPVHFIEQPDNKNGKTRIRVHLKKSLRKNLKHFRPLKVVECDSDNDNVIFEIEDEFSIFDLDCSCITYHSTKPEQIPLATLSL